MWTIPKIKEANKAAGQHWFSQGAMSFFKSKIYPETFPGWNGIYFVSSEQFSYDSPKKYTVRIFFPDSGRVKTASDFQEFPTKGRAIKAAKQMTMKQTENQNET